jgi:hypothetical protein
VIFGGGTSAETRETIVDHEKRITQLEKDSETTKALREAKNARREFWLVKMLPSISGVVVALLGLNAVFHWF